MEASGGEFWFSSACRRHQLRRFGRRFAVDPLLARLPHGDGSPRARGSVVLVIPERQELLGRAAAPRRRKARSDPPKLPHLEPCPDDWLYYKKKCCYHSEAMADWNSSQEFCADYGASLAVIDSHQELNFIMYRIRITDIWIGLRRKRNKFFWVNGESFDTNLFHVNITNDGDCVHIDSAFISTRSCSSLRNRLCSIGQFNPKKSS